MAMVISERYGCEPNQAIAKTARNLVTRLHRLNRMSGRVFAAEMAGVCGETSKQEEELFRRLLVKFEDDMKIHTGLLVVGDGSGGLDLAWADKDGSEHGIGRLYVSYC